jgi:very-short-patch-repair endonuclease
MATDTNNKWRPEPSLWQKVKPLARQKRQQATPAEERLWDYLRDRKLLGIKFRRQCAIGKFIVDFYCYEAQLIIEVDGLGHQYTVEEDAIRQQFLESLGFRVIRFNNEDVFDTLPKVLDQIKGALDAARSPTH